MAVFMISATIATVNGVAVQKIVLPKLNIGGFDRIPERTKIYAADGRVRSIFRAVFMNFKQGRIVEGGSTITQQLVKNIFLTNERTFDRKFREAILAYQLEHKFTKKKIMEIYLNTVYYGNGAYGVKTAAEMFFNKEPRDLTLEEAALLAGTPKAPGKFSPYLDPAGAKARRNRVLGRMAAMGYISETEK